jgi:hypothetical protein
MIGTVDNIVEPIIVEVNQSENNPIEMVSATTPYKSKINSKRL